MKTVELVPGIKSSVLGFGCAPVLGSVEPKKAAYAIHNAIDCGITHFDLARSYGYGEAEKFVGEILKSQRHNLVIASKFGIKANWKAKVLTPAKPLMWFINRKISLKNHTGQKIVSKNSVPVGDKLFKRVELSGKNMRNSLEKSLRALNTDYLDFYFIHEPLQKLLFFEDLMQTADKLKKEGKIRAFGLAFSREQSDIHKAYLSCFDVLQFNNSPGAIGYEALTAERGVKPNIIFSPLSGGSNKLKPSEKLSQIHSDFPNTVILCSMFTRSHLEENISAIDNSF